MIVPTHQTLVFLYERFDILPAQDRHIGHLYEEAEGYANEDKVFLLAFVF